MLPVLLLNPQPGEINLDLCAAPGNKCAQMSLMMQNTGTIIANDVHGGRLRAVNRHVDRLGSANISVIKFDGTSFPRQPFLFDRVIADVPCTCEGTCRKNPDILTEIPPKRDKITSIQTAILKRAMQLCKPGGRVVYATCTFAPEENEQVVNAALNEIQAQITAQILTPEMPSIVWSPGLRLWQGQKFRSDMENTIRIYPQQNNTGGFFIAVIEKIEDKRAQWRQRLTDEVASTMHATPAVDAKDYFSILRCRFGLEENIFQKYAVVQYNSKTVSVVNVDHKHLITERPVYSGLPFMKRNMKFPKLSTPAAMEFGKFLKKHIVRLNHEQTDRYFRNERFFVDANQVKDFDEDGYCLLTCDGFALGLGLLFKKDGRFEVASQYPKAWQLTAEKSAFRN